MNDESKVLREKIDAIDARLVKLLSARARVVQQVGHVKQGAAVYRPDREAQVLRRVTELNGGPLPAAAVQRIYTEIMSACRALEDTDERRVSRTTGHFQSKRPQQALRRRPRRSSRGSSIDEVFRRVETWQCRLRSGAGRELDRGRSRAHARSSARDARRACAAR